MKILYFAWFAEKLGKREEELAEELATDKNIDSLDKLIAFLCLQNETYQEIFAQKSLVKCAVNKRMVEGNAPLSPDDEIAFFPPITGG